MDLYTRVRDTRLCTAACLLIAIFLSVPPANGQVQVGDNLNVNLNGFVGFGYGGAYGNTGDSSHSTSLNGSGTLNGSYYNPNFLRFTLQPYYNRSQSNSASQSVFDETGFLGSVNLFSGSHFPGAVGFSKVSNTSGEFGIPGITGLTTDGSARSFNITWSEFLPNVPTLTATYATTSSDSTVLGTSGNNKTSSRNFDLSSTYTLAGFALNGFMNRQTTRIDFPSFLDTAATFGTNSTTTLGASATHNLPLSGTLGISWGRTSYSSEDGYRGSGVTNDLDGLVSIRPIRRLTLTGNVRYISNLLGALEQSIGNNGVPALVENGNTSHSLVLSSSAWVDVGHGVSVNGIVSHRRQFFFGRELSDTLYGGNVNFRFSRPLLGMLHFSFGLVDTANENGNSSLGFTGNIGMRRRFGAWEVSSDFFYTQNVQTLITLYTTSSYSYGGLVSRRLNQETHWYGSFRGTHSGLVQVAGSGNRAETVSTGFTWRRYSVAGNYSQSTGTTVLTGAGILNPTPLAPLLTEDILLFNARSYGFGFTAAPLQRLVVTASYSSVRNNTLSSTLGSLNRGERYDLRTEYRLRKLYFRGGFARTFQAISASGVAPALLNSYYFGITRWFNFF